MPYPSPRSRPQRFKIKKAGSLVTCPTDLGLRNTLPKRTSNCRSPRHVIIYVFSVQNNRTLMQGYNYCCTHMDIIHPRTFSVVFVLLWLKLRSSDQSRTKRRKRLLCQHFNNEVPSTHIHPP